MVAVIIESPNMEETPSASITWINADPLELRLRTGACMLPRDLIIVLLSLLSEFFSLDLNGKTLMGKRQPARAAPPVPLVPAVPPVPPAPGDPVPPEVL